MVVVQSEIPEHGSKVLQLQLRLKRRIRIGATVIIQGAYGRKWLLRLCMKSPKPRPKVPHNALGDRLQAPDFNIPLKIGPIMHEQSAWSSQSGPLITVC